MNNENIYISLQENNKNNEDITIEDLMTDIENIELNDDFNIDDFYSREINYDTNYTKKELEKIAAYYDIQKRNKKKALLIEEIILFEKNPDNICLVLHREKLWGYINELKEDPYLRQFIIFD